MLRIEQLVVGPLQVNCYIAYDEDTREAMIIDPGDDAEDILGVIQLHGLLPRLIVCTHGHFDHIGAVAAIKKTGAEIILHRSDLPLYERADDQASIWGYSLDQPPTPDIFVSEGDILAIGNIKARVFHTPGHSPGSICLLHENMLVTGDTIFAGSIGRTDFQGGSLSEMKRSFRRIIDMPPDTTLLPGHGPGSTVARERETNFFIHEL